MRRSHHDLLRESGLRVTAPRLAVLDVVEATPHVDADTVRGEVAERLGAVSTQAVYDILRTLTDAGILRRTEPAGSPSRYEIATGDNHHHLVCRGCGNVVDVPCAVGKSPCLHASDDHGFLIDSAEVIYWGYCPSCLSNSAS
ncbi:Fur family transcriptional regulator [Saccharomonospora glauca]|jgi:Fe2+ or Zn2+ uptake regulation protein|uniref:Fe2+/Zn2+ uptake regulation protein n=1 Tax=Saccharomonospora glauca K62 TaxID=928724 RepID=I1D1S8_9PSEU|nr:Fur family transcriptional regulator [Saccharomonospora glauca]EIE98902.1 Fe2+/Zn2+ uptake regulation protein [Saccharomonospora glauca K62]